MVLILTYIVIRPGKDSSSTALSHGLDFETLLDLKELEDIIRSGIDRLVKPIVVITVGRGPDENPCYQKVIKVGVHHLPKHNLDALFIAANAAGRSAFSRVEWTRAPLCRELCGLILPHDNVGTRKVLPLTQNLKKRLCFSWQGVGEIWSKLIVVGLATVAEYI